MKKATIILAAILMAITLSGQVKGVDLENAVEVRNENDLDNYPEQWVKLYGNDYQGAYVFCIVNDNAVDFKHLITELDRVLKANDLDINKPDLEDDLFPLTVEGINDYSGLSTWVPLGEAEIIRSYVIDDWIIGIICNYNGQVLFMSEVQE